LYTNYYTNPSQNRLRATRSNYLQKLAKSTLPKVIARNNRVQPRAGEHKSLLPYKEEVAGSNPASPTEEKRHLAGKTLKLGEGPWYQTRALVQQRCSNAALTQCLSHRVGGLVAHSWEHVGVGVQGDGYGGVPQKLLDELRVNFFLE
jgi:hypothetical protein